MHHITFTESSTDDDVGSICSGEWKVGRKLYFIFLFCFSQYDAILFHQRSLSKTDLPQKRKAEQKYIMYMLESASYPFGFVRYVHYPEILQDLWLHCIPHTGAKTNSCP